MSFFEDLRLRRNKLADVLNDSEYSGIRQIVEELYPDRAHFIYELLQNAEDKCARSVNFVLKEDSLVFEHDGQPFDKQDVEAITNIGKGAKRDQEDKIGRFGIGFKAVFAYTETPHIWSPTYSFKIENLVLPSEVAHLGDLNSHTRFEFPFNNPKKPRGVAYEEVAAGLEELADTTLLFLSNIKALAWSTDNGSAGGVRKIVHSDRHVELFTERGAERSSGSHYLLFSNAFDIEGRPKHSVSVAYALEFTSGGSGFDRQKPIAEQLKIVPAKPGKVAVFFPADKETSGLRFHVHGPFIPELSRASIKETPANEPIFQKLAELVGASLFDIRNLGLLNGEFLAVLPNTHDELGKRYAVIRDAIIKAMNNDPLTPTHRKGHAPARTLLQARAALKDLIPDEDLKYFVENKKRRYWAISASQRNSNQDHFLSDLEIETWDTEQFVGLLYDKAGYCLDETFGQWLSIKSAIWHQQMYALLHNDLNNLASDNEKEIRIRTLRSLEIVRHGDGTYSAGEECYFPSEGVEHDKVFPRVDRMVYESGERKRQKEDARAYLEEIGVREVGEEEEVLRILKTRYGNEDFAPKLKDLGRFVRFVENNPDRVELFSDYCIFSRVDDTWGRPDACYLDAPFYETMLSAYYDAFDDELKPIALNPAYLEGKLSKERIIQFAKALGAIHELPVRQVPCFDNPQWDYLSGGLEASGSSQNDDYVIEHLSEALKSPEVELSRLVWRRLNSLGSEVLQATYRRGRKGEVRRADSQFVHLLRSAAWVPQKNGSFVKPCDASRDQLPRGFPYDAGQAWLTRVEFGETAKRLSQEYKTNNQFAVNIGFDSLDAATKAAEFVKIAKQQGITLEDLQLQLKTDLSKRAPAFPVKAVPNPERREDRLVQTWKASAEKKSEQLMRTVRTSRGAIDPTAWLKNQYTNEAGEIICQICREVMPFRKPDGEFYFEAVELLSREHFSKEHEAQFVALCPLCAAKYKVFVKSDEDAMRILLRSLMDSSERDIALHFGGSAARIRFVETHWLDLRKIIQLDGLLSPDFKGP